MEEEWITIPGFVDYQVSNKGRVARLWSGRPKKVMTLTVNPHGTVYVGLSRNNIQRKRSVALLVASAFLPKPESSHFNTPVHLDCNRSNNEVSNLAWRPKWFAPKYHEQVNKPYRSRINKPIVNLDTNKRFPNSLEAALCYGVLEQDVVRTAYNVEGYRSCFPTNHRFEVL